MEKEQMNIVILGHVDHGKSTVIGRLLADTGSLHQGKLDQIKEYCERNSKPFEYAFLLDALKDEQNQGITIDIARCFFKTEKRDYNILDSPGHIEFLKNMISGTAKAEAALLVIDSQEGIQENSRRHAYLLSLLGIKQVIVLINKMDLVAYSEEIFNSIKEEYAEFMSKIGLNVKEFIPVSAMKGDNIAMQSSNLSWFNGNTVLSSLDSFKKSEESSEKPLRMPVQNVYKFTSKGDSRRIIAGKVESGKIRVGDKVVFLPSSKISEIESIEEYNSRENISEIFAGCSTGVRLKEQIYINRSEVMCKLDEKTSKVSSIFKSSIFWMGKDPLIEGKEYKLKIATSSIPVKVKKIISIIDASELSNIERSQVNRHEVAECIFESKSPLAFDLFNEIPETGRFVIVDDYDISGGGIITEYLEDNYSEIRAEVREREEKWDKSAVTIKERSEQYKQIPKIILLTGPKEVDKKTTARKLEMRLFNSGNKPYFLGIRNILRGLDSDISKEERKEHLRRFAEVGHILVDAGLLTIITASDLSKEELKLIQEIVSRDSLIIINIGNNGLNQELMDLVLESDKTVDENTNKIIDLLKNKGVIFSI